MENMENNEGSPEPSGYDQTNPDASYPYDSQQQDEYGENNEEMEEGHGENYEGEMEYLEEEDPENEEGGHGKEYDEDESGYPSHMQEGGYNQQNSEGNYDQVSGERIYEESRHMNQGDDQKEPEKHFSYDDDADIETLFEQDFELIKKVRKLLLNNINKERMEKGLSHFSIDIITNLIATDYANYLKNNSHNANFFQLLCDQYKQPENEAIHLIHLYSKFEEDVHVNEERIIETFEEIGLVLLESVEERLYLFDPNLNHVGLGVAATNEGIIVVQIMSQKIITIRSIMEVDDNVVEVKGKMLDDKYGLYAARILNLDMNSKEIMKCGPEKIDFDRKTKEFILTLNVENPFKGVRKLIEYFVKINPDLILYKKQTRDKLKLSECKSELKTPCMLFPDLRIIDIEEIERPYMLHGLDKNAIKESLQMKAEVQKEEVKVEEKQDINEDPNKDKFGESTDFKGLQSQVILDNEEKMKKIAFEQAKEQAISNKEIKEELEISLADAQKQYDELMQQNYFLQEKIKLLRNKNDVMLDKQDVAMNEHKYLNTLAHVHQIRLDLKQTQDKYNKMASDLQKKLEEKQKKCNEIKMTFMELKREVARKAAFSRTDKPIPEKMIDEWEERELEKNKILQELRLDILRLRNNLAKNKKILKKKEELAEGLHLIDFEQLKIENQTLNEKIEERNEDLHKLKKKNTTTVQILTHTREKLGFVQKKNDDLQGVGEDKEKDLTKRRYELSSLKKDKDSCRISNIQLKQQSGIVNIESLRKDFQFRKTNIKKLEQKRDSLSGKLMEMEKMVSQFNKMKDSAKKSDKPLNENKNSANKMPFLAAGRN